MNPLRCLLEDQDTITTPHDHREFAVIVLLIHGRKLWTCV